VGLFIAAVLIYIPAWIFLVGLENMAGLPYTTTIASYADIQALERDVRQLMRCKGNTCAFLQSAEYKNLSFAMTRSLCGQPSVEQKIHIPHTNMVMHISHDMKICIQLVEPPDAAEFAAEIDDTATKKRRRV
jgi:hypothetical protein